MSKSTIFIAVQCCQCSTMQVKQQKKSSNKWTCVVCNEKQSVRKVYAQGYQAKDVRQFVQSFNMSRKLADEQAAVQNDEDSSLRHFVEHLEGNQEVGEKKMKRRADWSEYIEDEEIKEPVYLKSVSKGANTFEPEIVTEFPDEGMFKKPKLKGKYDRSSSNEMGEVYKPQFSKRDTIKRNFKPQVEVATKEPIKTQTRFPKVGLASDKYVGSDSDLANNVRKSLEDDQQKQHMPTTIQGASKWSGYNTSHRYLANDSDLLRSARRFSERDQQKQHIATEKRGASKWSEYMVGDEGTCFQGENSAFSDDMNLMVQYDLETNITDQRVEDDVHPDFL